MIVMLFHVIFVCHVCCVRSYHIMSCHIMSCCIDHELLHITSCLLAYFILPSDPLYKLSAPEMELLFSLRSSLIRYPHVLPKFLQCIEWSNPIHVMETYKLLNVWAPPVSM